jgi:hypothetical protein
VGGWVASWFLSKDAISFAVAEAMFATLVLAAVVTLFVYWQTLVGYWRSLWKRMKGGCSARIISAKAGHRAPSHGPCGGVADSLDEAKAAFRAAGERAG